MMNFNLIPPNLRSPFVAVEFDPSQSQQGPALLNYQAILMGQKLNTGLAAADTVVRATSVADAIAAGGRGSMIHREAVGWFATSPGTQLRIGVLADASAGSAATATIAVSGSAPANGAVPPIALYLGAIRLLVGVNNLDSASTIASNIAAVINAAPDLPVTASASSGTVTIVFRHKGLVGNSYDIRHSFLPGDALPAGVTLNIAAMSGGAGNPSLSNLITAMSGLWFEIWAHPYTDVTSLMAIENELADRAGPMRSMDGLAITSASGNFSALATLGTSRNSPSSIIVAPPGRNPLTPPMEFAAEVAALVARYGSADPAKPFQTLAMSNAIATLDTDAFTEAERNLLLFDGIATTKATAGGGVQLGRIITTYQTNTSGQPDAAYLDATTRLTLLYLRYDLRQLLTTKFPRHKLADDGTRFASGQEVMTPSIGRAVALTWFRDNERRGLVQGYDAFKANLIVERDISNRNQLNYLVPPGLMNGLINQNLKLQFRL